MPEPPPGASPLRQRKQAQARRYGRVRLDTHRPSMTAAVALYRSLGFYEIPAYGPDLDGDIGFFEKLLD